MKTKSMVSPRKVKLKQDRSIPGITPDPFAKAQSHPCPDATPIGVSRSRELPPTIAEEMASDSEIELYETAPTPERKTSIRNGDPYSNNRIYKAEEPQIPTKTVPVGKLFPPPRSPLPSPLNPAFKAGEAYESKDELKTPTASTFPRSARSRRDSAATNGTHAKLDKVLGSAPGGTLACLYLVSGLGKDGKQWAYSDSESINGVQPIEDSLGLFWRPDVLGTTFPANSEGRGERKESRVGAMRSAVDIRNAITGATAAKLGIESGEAGVRMVAKALKLAHPREVEVVNATLAPPTTCHAFIFTLPKADTVSSRLHGSRTMSEATNPYQNPQYSTLSPTSLAKASARPAEAIKSNPDTGTTFYGVTMTVWTHADKDRTAMLKDCKDKARRSRNGLLSVSMASLGSHDGRTPMLATEKKRRGGMPWKAGRSRSSFTDGDVTASETEGAISDSDLESGRARIRGISMGTRISAIESLPEDAADAFEEGHDLYWMPYALTLVSRYPLYDLLQDFLKLSWARFSRNAKAHTLPVQERYRWAEADFIVQRVLNKPVPRAGEPIGIRTGIAGEDDIELHGRMPGGLEYDQALVSVDFQMWPLFKALDLDNILTCVEIALSHSGRVVFYSRHPAMLNIAVQTLKYLVDLRGWSGLALPLIHARDSTIIIEDPGPYIIGVNSECRFVLTAPPEVLVVDLDVNSIACPSPPDSVISRGHARDRQRKKLLAALGDEYASDFGIPPELKITYPSGRLRPYCHIVPSGFRPLHYIGERVVPPRWFDSGKVLGVFDKIMVDKAKNPTFYQRITKPSKQPPQLTMGEQMAKTMMRKRALHYVETRDDLELRISRINRRLLKLMEVGEHWKKQFEHFEKYADKLADEANELKIKIDRERRESRRLSNVVNEQTQQNSALQTKLRETEDARTIAMRQLSDMHASIQELERERDEMMNAIEAQLSEAMTGLPTSAVESPYRPGTPTSCDQSSISSSRNVLRQPSIISLDTGNAMSVLGAAGARAQQRMSSSTYKRSARHEKSMAERLASIQQKLEMALVNVTSQARVSLDDAASDTTAHEDPDDSIGTISPPDDQEFQDAHESSVMVTTPSENTLVEEIPFHRPPIPPRSLSRQSSAGNLPTTVEEKLEADQLSAIPGSPIVATDQTTHKGISISVDDREPQVEATAAQPKHTTSSLFKRSSSADSTSSVDFIPASKAPTSAPRKMLVCDITDPPSHA